MGALRRMAVAIRAVCGLAVLVMAGMAFASPIGSVQAKAGALITEDPTDGDVASALSAASDSLGTITADFGWAITFQILLGWLGVGYGFIGQWGLFVLSISAIVPLAILQVIYKLSQTYTFKETGKQAAEENGLSPFDLSLIVCTICFFVFAVVLWIFGIA